MNNLFSTFDPSSSFILSNWCSVILPYLVIPSVYWVSKNQLYQIMTSVMAYLHQEFTLNLGVWKSPGHTHLFISCFMFMLINNFLGLTPYTFTSSSHLSFSLTLGLSMWLGYFLWSFIMDLNHALAHLLPLNTPKPLMPVMILIESISSVIRPLTLSVRLAANMVAGHLLLSLISSPATSSMTLMVSILFPLLILVSLESAVAWIQAYVFSMLTSLYISENNYTSIQ